MLGKDFSAQQRLTYVSCGSVQILPQRFRPYYSPPFLIHIMKGPGGGAVGKREWGRT